MIEILQWSTLAVCGLIALARVPSALRGENRTLFYIFALLTLAILLSIEAPYLAIDQFLGGINITNVILRFVIFAAIFFVGVRVTKGFGADDAYRLIAGRAGKVEYYGAAGRAYPSYVSLVLLPAMIRAVRSRLPVMVRIAAALLAVGGISIALTLLFPVFPPAMGAAKYIVNYTAVLCYVVGLALIWAAKVRSKKAGV